MLVFFLLCEISLKEFFLINFICILFCLKMYFLKFLLIKILRYKKIYMYCMYFLKIIDKFCLVILIYLIINN